MSAPDISRHLYEMLDTLNQFKLVATMDLSYHTLHEIISILINHKTVLILQYFAHYTGILEQTYLVISLLEKPL